MKENIFQIASGDTTKLGKYAFAERTDLEQALIEDGIRRIGESCFFGCANLESIVLPDSVCSIQKDAFRNCTKLKSITLPEGLTMIKKGTFAGCRSLERIVIPASVRVVEDEAFAGCSSLKEVIFMGAGIRVYQTTFEGCICLDNPSISAIAEHFSEPVPMRFRSDLKGIAGRLANSSERHFVFDGVECCSIEGVIKSFNYQDEEKQRETCHLSGRAARDAAMEQSWKEEQTLYWKKQPYPRESEAYQRLLDRLYQTVYEQDPQFRLDVEMLKGSGTHTDTWLQIKRSYMKQTLLTKTEYIGRLLAWSCMPESSEGKKLHYADILMEQLAKEKLEENTETAVDSSQNHNDTHIKKEWLHHLCRPMADTETQNPQNKKIQKVVVLGGSFHPPTVAHRALLLDGVAAAGANIGIFVPTSYQYVQKKMKRKSATEAVLPDKTRLLMLLSMTDGYETLLVDDCEMRGAVTGFTYEMLEHIASNYPDAKIYFLVGCDKLHIIPKWHRVEEFLERFRILVAKRGGETPEQLIAEHPFLCKHKNAFLICSISDDMSHISSSAVREYMETDHEKAKQMVTDEVWQMLREHQEMAENSIRTFRGEYDFLSNFHAAPLEYGGLFYQNAEAAFQAQKCAREEEKANFIEIPAAKAKRLGRQVKLRDDWESVKISLMEDIVRAKFTQNPHLAAKLLETKDRPLIEGNTWGDTCWGVDLKTGKGDNHLGRILMKVRAELTGMTGTGESK